MNEIFNRKIISRPIHELVYFATVFAVIFVVISECPGLFPNIVIINSCGPSGYNSIYDGSTKSKSGCCVSNTIVTFLSTNPSLLKLQNE